MYTYTDKEGYLVTRVVEYDLGRGWMVATHLPKEFFIWCSARVRGTIQDSFPEYKGRIKAIHKAIEWHLEFGYVDGYCYSDSEWEFLKIRYCENNLYYCLVKIETTELGADEAYFEAQIDETGESMCVLVGSNDSETDCDLIWEYNPI